MTQVIYTYDYDIEKREEKTFKIVKCPESYFKTEYEKKFYREYGSELLCVPDDGIYI